MSTRTCRYGFLCLSLLIAASGARGEELPPDIAVEPCAPNQIAKLLASNGARVRTFGIVSAIDGDRAVVGTAPSSADLGTNLRSAYVFERSGGTWTEVAELVSADAASFDWFGFAVAIDGDTVVVGARDASGVVAHSGAAYVFERQAGGGWIQSAKLFAADGIALERFGEEVAISGDTIAIGAEFGTTTVPHAGEVFVYERNAGSPGAWGQVAHVVAFDPRGVDGYGNSVDLDGDLMAVGAPGDDDLGESSGSVYLYGRDTGGPGAWGLLAKLTADDGVAGDQLGQDVAVSGTTLLASAYFHAGADTRSGAAYVFERDLGGPGAWGQVTEIVASDGAFEDWFGRQVALDGSTAIVGAPLHDDGGSSSGSAYVFERHVGGSDHWGESAKLTAGDAQAGDGFGHSVGISGSTLLVGAPQDDDDGGQAGSAYLFECVPAGGVDSDGDGSDDTIDCDDDDATIHPGAPETCDGIDNNCNDAVDEGLDADGDGLADCFDGCPQDAAKSGPGACGCGVADTDTDGDGLADCLDQCPTDPNKTVPGTCGCGVLDLDSDLDGVLDCLDQCPADAGKTAPGLCGCGVPDTDSDGDGSPDCTDLCAVDPLKAAPGLCGCGVADDDTDGDGLADCLDACALDPFKTAPGACGCGVADTDTDGDGSPDCLDACPADGGKVEPGACGCGVADGDADGDGLPDCLDQCALDPAKSEPGICGCGVPETDSDGDGLADCLDACPQSDLAGTVVIDACDSGVGNTEVAAGCTIGDEIGRCLQEAGSHGQFVSCVAHLTKDLKKDGVISGEAKGALDSCAGQSSLP